MAPIYPIEVGLDTVSLTGTHDAYALAHVLEACRKIGIEPAVASAASIPEGIDTNVICIGGYYVNSVTKASLAFYCRRFELFTATVPGLPDGLAPRRFSEEDGSGSGGEVVGQSAYRCGPHEFIETLDVAWGFLVKLGPKLTGRLHTTILVWGLGALGTSGASYFLSNLPGRLPAAGRDSFFVAIPVQRAMGYKGVSTKIVDITSEVWWPDKDARV